MGIYKYSIFMVYVNRILVLLPTTLCMVGLGRNGKVPGGTLLNDFWPHALR